MKNNTPKLAVLIDADNTSHKTIGLVLQEIVKYGIPIVKRVYGDWSSEIDENGKLTNRLHVWRDVSLSHAITPVQQFAYTKGKDATDMMLIINAMDLLYGNQLDGFCIISSDSDFTPLASRIRESGLMVYGFGKKQTPSAFISACDKFIYIENLIDSTIEKTENLTINSENQSNNLLKSEKVNTAKPKETSETKQPINQEPQTQEIPKPNIQPNQVVQVDEQTLQLIYKAIKDIADDDGWANLADLGKHLTVLKPDFDTRTYGRAKLSGLLQALGLFAIKQENSQKFVRKKPSFLKVLKVLTEVFENQFGQNFWVPIDYLVKKINSNYPDLNPEDYGYKNTHDMLLGINSKYFEIDESKAKIRLLSIKS